MFFVTVFFVTNFFGHKKTVTDEKLFACDNFFEARLNLS